MGVELLYADGQTDGKTDMTTLIVVFRSFANALKNLNRVATDGKELIISVLQ